MKRTFAILVAAGLMLPVVGIFAASHLQAQTESPVPEETSVPSRPGTVGEGERGDRAERLIEELNLTEDQINQVRAIREGAQDEMQALHERLRSDREALHGLMAGDATEAELRAQHEEIQTLHREVADKRFETMLATREVLTADQRAELAELMEQRRAQFRENRGFHGGQKGQRGGHHW